MLKKIFNVNLEAAGVSRGRPEVQMKIPAKVDPITFPADRRPIRRQQPIVQFGHHEVVGTPTGRMMVRPRRNS